MKNSDLTWRKSSFSDNSGPVCVEVAGLPGGGAAIRDSKNPDGPRLNFTGPELRAFVLGAKAGEFDDLI